MIYTTRLDKKGDILQDISVDDKYIELIKTNFIDVLKKAEKIKMPNDEEVNNEYLPYRTFKKYLKSKGIKGYEV